MSRLTGLDASFLALETGGSAHMHVGSVLVFEGPAPDYDGFKDRIDRGGTAPQAQEHVLDDVLSERRIAEHAVGAGIHLAVVVVEREAEGARLSQIGRHNKGYTRC